MKRRILFLFSLPLMIFMGLATLACPVIGLGERVDLKNPECAFTSLGNSLGDEEKIVSGSYISGKVTLKGSCSDDIGVTEVYVGIGSQENLALATLAESKTQWSYEFDTTAQVDGEIEIFLKAKDAYGREGKNKTMLVIDNTAPIIVVNSAQGYGSPASDYKIAIKGEAADNYRIKSVEITTDSPAVSVTSLIGTFAWSAGLYASISGTYNLTITATDYAGNKSTIIFVGSEVVAENDHKDLTADEIFRIYTLGSIEGATVTKGVLETLKKGSLPISVNLDDDIPKISLSSMDTDESTVNFLGTGALIIGRVFDDDAVNPNSLRMKYNAPFDLTDPNDGEAVPISDITGFGQLISFATPIPAGYQDGSTHKLYLTVKDVHGVQGFLGPLQFKINLGAPTIKITSHISGAAIKSSSVTIEGIISDNEEGKTVECYDEANHKIADGVFTDVTDLKNKKFSIPLTGLAEGTNNLRIVGSDLEFSTSFNLTLNVDTESPRVNIITPKKDLFVNGEVTVRGNFSDNYILKEGFYAIGRSDGAPTQWKEITDMHNFSFEVPTQEYEDASFSIAEGGAGNTVKILPIRFKVEDKAGNITETDNDFFFLKVDNHLDRPSVIILSPKDKTTLGGSTFVTGSSSDDEDVYAIYMRIDCNGDGLFNKKFDLSKNGSINSASHTVTKQGIPFKIANETNPLEFFEDESLWYRLPDGVNPWQCRLNQSGEFYKVEAEHKGTIHIQVIAQDTKDGVNGDIFGDVKTLELTFDDTIPFIEGISPDPKVPIRKTITFEADFYDRKTGSSATEGIKHVEISYNNGIKWQSLNDHSGLISTPGVGQYADYDHKHLTLSLDTTDTATYPTTRGQLFIKLKVVDLAGYVSILPVTYSVDNVFPEANLTSPDLMDQAGNAVKIQGTATDSGEISGIKEIHVYFTTKNGKFFIKPNDGSVTESTTGKTMLLKEGTGAETETIYPSNADYLMKIDSFTENGKDNEAGFGDNDGYAESLALTGSVYNWWVQFDSTKNFTDGEYTVHYVAFDLAGNGTHYKKQAFIKNNKPVLSNFAVGTDVNGNGTIANVDALKIVEIFNYDPTDLIVGRNNKIRVQFNITSNNKIQSIELNKDGDNVLPASITGYEDQTAFSVNADIDTTSFLDGHITVTCKVTDKVGITVSQNVELILRNKSSDHPTIEIRERSDRFSTITRKINDIDVSFKKLLTPDSENKKWQYIIYGNTESQDATVDLGEKVLPTVVGNYIAPNLSGNLLFEVDAKDDQGIKEIYFVQGTTETKIAQRNAGTGMLEACHTNCVIQTEARLAQSISQKKGQVVSLLFEWEAKEIAPIDSQSAGFKVVDTTGDNGQTNVANDNYAINPYITEIVSELSKSHSVGSFFGRSATGKYPIRDTETITIKGWNFGDKGEIKVMCNGAELTHNVSGDDLTVEIKDISGGKLELHQDVIKSQNGKNPTKLQSKEPNNISNNNLDDTREIFVLKQNILKANVTKEARFPRMRMLSNGKPIFVFAEGSKYISTVDPVFHNRWERSYTQYYYSDLAFATNKPAHYASFRDGVVYTLNGDIASGTCGTSRVIAFGRKTSDGDTDYVDLTQAKSFLESIRSKGEFITERVPNASFVLCGTETKQKVHAYLSYFDAAKNSICYRYGKIEKTGGSDFNPIINFTDGFVGGCSIVPYAPVTDDGSAPNVQIIAGPTEAGAYTSLAVHNDGKKAALFWYDARSSSLKCKITNDAQDKEPTWGDTIIIDPEYAGQYVAAKFDGDKIGCAYYCSAKGDLRYATLENVGAKKATVYTVDALLSVGLNVDLEYIDHVPYISYYNASYNATTRSVKVAYQINQKNGADEQDLFTGDWEVYTIPNTNTPKDFKASIGNGGGKPCVGFATDAAIEYWTIN